MRRGKEEEDLADTGPGSCATSEINNHLKTTGQVDASRPGPRLLFDA